ncbi:hypothetical protein BIW11_01919 [Tropilaelaps mercedesae]|uniref:Uncharacterized protein n=1 Tax=Tropilaelaps mercedesae TaxID=418985 RepID=A0A1V9X683_9ACAR|nr:hypothetical protein BIW11_01919 [Tropilaelaps mercedesae]
MSALNRLIVVNVLAAFVVLSVDADGCHLRELDLCSSTAASVSGVPLTDADVDKYCDLAKEAVDCFNDYRDKCMTPLQKELVSYAVGDRHKQDVDKFCTKGDELRDNYLKQAPCLAKAHVEGKKCEVDGQAALEKLEEAPLDDKVTTACCAYARFRKCSHDVIETMCGAEVIEYAGSMIHIVSSNLIDIVCQGFDSNPLCDRLLPPPGTQPKGNGKSLISRLINTYTKS